MTTEQINSIITQFELGQEYFVWQMSEANSDMDEADRLEEFYNEVVLEQITDEGNEKVLALMEHTSDNWDDVESMIDDTYMVLTEDEADEAFDKYLDNYLDDVILPEIPEHLQCYFDRDSWKNDAEIDGRTSALSSYDGNEHEETINGTIYYIYKN